MFPKTLRNFYNDITIINNNFIYLKACDERKKNFIVNIKNYLLELLSISYFIKLINLLVIDFKYA